MVANVEIQDIKKKLSIDVNARPIVQPEDGRAPVLELIHGAQLTILIKMFTFDDPEILEAVVAAQKRGVKVAVMLNPKRSSGSRANDVTREALLSAGVSVRWTNPKYYVTHEKSMVVDSEHALIANFNFVAKCFSLTRDFGVIIDDISCIADMAACFAADWRRAGFNPAPDTPLLWSRANSRVLIARFIDCAERRLDIQHPKIIDATILDRLIAALERGVKVRFLCGGKAGISDFDMPDTFSSLRILKTNGAKIRRLKKGLRLHSKLMIADRSAVQLGSMNIDRSAFDLRRELGIVLRGGDAARRFQTVFDSDWEEGSRYLPPDPVSVLPPPEEEDELAVAFAPDDVHE